MKKMELIYQLEKLHEAYFEIMKVAEARSHKELELEQSLIKLRIAIVKIQKEFKEN